MKVVLHGLWFGLVLTAGGCGGAAISSNRAENGDKGNAPRFLTAEELDRLPVGIEVVHDPTVALATLTEQSKRRAKYTWWYKTTVSATEGDVTVVEFGAMAWEDGKWVNGRTFTGKPFSTEEFAEWYTCPKGVLEKGNTYADPTNWSTDPVLRARKMRWYFVGQDLTGKRVKGEAIVELKAELDPNKPRDPK